MNVTPVQWARLELLTRVIEKQCQYLTETDQRLFGQPLTADQLQTIKNDPLNAERLDAFRPTVALNKYLDPGSSPG